MIANGYDVAVMEHHTSSSGGGYTNVYSQARISYYGISGIPNSYFDGITNVLGGSSGTYSQFLSKYNQRKAVNSNFTIAINGSNNGLNYAVLLTMEMVEPYTGGTNLVAHLALTESNLSYSGSIFNHVTRLFVPSASGTPVNFTSNPLQTLVLEFTKNSGWVLGNCELIAFIQNNSTKEILQAIKVPLDELFPMATDAELVSVYNVPAKSCSGKANPYLRIKNTTSNNLVAASIKYKINDESLLTYNWSGNLGLNQEALFQLPQITFTALPENLFTAYIQTSNGVLDPNNVNDTVNKAFLDSESYFSTINLEILTDNNPQQTTWQVINSNNQVVFSGGPYTGQPNTLIQTELQFQESGCYKFVISDSGNDGICCASGNGYFSLRDIDDQLIYTNGDFGPKETVEFEMRITILDILAYLEGPFDQSSFIMSTTLNQLGLIPLNQPYNTEPWNYNGTENVTAIPGPDIVDWVLVELRETTGGPETATSSTIIARQAAFLNYFGYIVGLDGTSTLKFDISINDNLFIVLHHRNHLSIMNADPLPAGSYYYFDFSATVDFIYGGEAGCKNILGTVQLAGGNANGDGIIDSQDLNTAWGTNAGKQGYYSGDINLNKQVNNQDKNGLINLNYLMESQVPD